MKTLKLARLLSMIAGLACFMIYCLPEANGGAGYDWAMIAVLVLFLVVGPASLIGNIKERWADSHTWSDKELSTKHMEDRMYFPVYVKTSYTRNAPGEPLTKWGVNIGLSVRGIERKA